MLKYVLLFAIIGCCFGADDMKCPSGKNETQINDACMDKLYVWGNCSIGAGSDASENKTCLEDA